MIAAEGIGRMRMKLTEAMMTALRAAMSHPSNLVYAGRVNGYSVSANAIKALAKRGLVNLLPAKSGERSSGVVAVLTWNGAAAFIAAKRGEARANAP